MLSSITNRVKHSNCKERNQNPWNCGKSSSVIKPRYNNFILYNDMQVNK